VILPSERARERASGPSPRADGAPLRRLDERSALVRSWRALSPATALVALTGFGALTALLAGCGLEPEPPVLEFSVSPEVRLAFEDSGFEPEDAALAAGRVEGALQLFFGSPRRPGYLALDAWAEADRDPNSGQDELDEEAWQSVLADNELRFAPQIDAVLRGDTAHLPRSWSAPATWKRWKWAFSPLIEGRVEGASLHAASPMPGDSDAEPFTWGEAAERFWRERYPSLAESAALYQRHCVHCHGATGSGDGPSGEWLDPAPRDFRRGVFKWVAVDNGYRPRRTDLQRVLERGVEGTAMPSFLRLSRAEREGLVDWVRLLAIRGETELLVTALGAQRGNVTPELATKAYERSFERWDDADERFAVVPPLPGPNGFDVGFDAERVARGAALFSGEIAQCATCHGEGGRGDGVAIWEDDGEGNRVRRADVWGQPSAPRDLTLGVFRGGDRPADLYRRIRYGIGGTIMPAAASTLEDEDVWALVAYVLSRRASHVLTLRERNEVPR